MEHNALFEKTPPLKLFFLAAIPGGISMLAGSVYGILDGIFVGRILGETAFAAVNLVFPLIFINFSLADLVGVDSAVPISIALGQQKQKEANNIFTCAFLAFLPFLRGTLLLKLCRPKFSAPMLRRIIACGSPNFLSNVAGRITSIVMNIVLLRFGGESAIPCLAC